MVIFDEKRRTSKISSYRLFEHVDFHVNKIETVAFDKDGNGWQKFVYRRQHETCHRPESIQPEITYTFYVQLDRVSSAPRVTGPTVCICGYFIFSEIRDSAPPGKKFMPVFKQNILSDKL